MEYDRTVSAANESVATIAAADDSILELSIPANVTAEILRVEIGPHEGATPPNPTPWAMYTATAAGTGGAAVTETLQSGSGTIQGSVLKTLTAIPVTGLREMPQGAIAWEVGVIYVPVPEERIKVVGGGQDFFGFHFLAAPSATPTFTAHIVWGEIG
jgi:hypothetical protein